MRHQLPGMLDGPTQAKRLLGWDRQAPATATRFARRATRQGLPSPKPENRQFSGICSLAPDVEKFARPVRGRVLRVTLDSSNRTKPLYSVPRWRNCASSIMCASGKRITGGNTCRSWSNRKSVRARPTEMQESCITCAGEDGTLRWRNASIGIIGKRLGISGELRMIGVAPVSPKPDA